VRFNRHLYSAPEASPRYSPRVGGHVVVITSNRDLHVRFGSQYVIGRVEAAPPMTRYQGLTPGVGGAATRALRSGRLRI